MSDAVTPPEPTDEEILKNLDQYPNRMTNLAKTQDEEEADAKKAATASVSGASSVSGGADTTTSGSSRSSTSGSAADR